MPSIFSKLANIFKVPDLRKRVLFTLGLLAVYRIGGHIPTPGINGDRLAQFFEQNKGSVLGFVDLFSGGNLRRLTIFALGIMPYITASIILQLLTVVYEPLAKLQKEGEMGREKITERGIGNGMSLLIFAGIVTGLPRGIADLYEKARNDAWGAFTVPAIVMLLVLMIAVVAFIVYVERSERRIPVQYAKRVVGRKVMGGQSTHLP